MLTALATPWQVQHDDDLRTRRGGPPTRKPAGGHPPALTLTEQTLVTVLRLRFRPPQPVLAELFGVTIATIATAERRIRPLLGQCGYAIPPATPQLRILADLTAHARAHGIDLIPKPKPAR